MVGAADGALDLAGFFNQDHAAMSAGILKDPDNPLAVADQQQRHTQKCDGLCIAGVRYVCCDRQRSPLRKQQGITFFDIGFAVNVVRVGQTIGLFNGQARQS